MKYFFIHEVNCKVFRRFKLLYGGIFGYIVAENTHITRYYNEFHFCKEFRHRYTHFIEFLITSFIV